MMSPVTYLRTREALGADWWDDQSYIFYQSDALSDFLEAAMEVYDTYAEAEADNWAKLRRQSHPVTLDSHPDTAPF